MIGHSIHLRVDHADGTARHGHVHVSVFIGKDEDHRAKSGDLVFRVDEFWWFVKQFPAVKLSGGPIPPPSWEERMSESPNTDAGKAAELKLPHFDYCAGMRGPNPCDCGVVASILAIEADAAGAERARAEMDLSRLQVEPLPDLSKYPAAYENGWLDGRAAVLAALWEVRRRPCPGS